MCFPKSEREREKFAQGIGSDGFELLSTIDSTFEEFYWFKELPVIMTLRKVWEQQYIVEPPSKLRSRSRFVEGCREAPLAQALQSRFAVLRSA